MITAFVVIFTVVGEQTVAGFTIVNTGVALIVTITGSISAQIPVALLI